MNFTSAINLTTSVSDEQAIEKILDDFIAAWNAHDVKSFLKLFAADLPSFLISSFARNVSTTIRFLPNCQLPLAWNIKQ